MFVSPFQTFLIINWNYCDLRGWIKGAARTLYPVYVERANMANIVRTILAILARWCALFRIPLFESLKEG